MIQSPRCGSACGPWAREYHNTVESVFTVVTNSSEKELERKCSFGVLSVQFVAPSPQHGGKDLEEGRGRGVARNQGAE